MICLLVMNGCASRARRDERPRPTRIEPCESLFKQIENRDTFFESFRGRANLRSSQGSVELSVVTLPPHYIRAEILGPLGVRLAFFNVDTEWVQFFLPREGQLHRIPFEEFSDSSSARRALFLRRLPFPIMPELLPDLFSTRVGLSAYEQRGCFYRDDMNAYILRLAQGRVAIADRVERVLPERLVAVDPSTLAPLQQWIYGNGWSAPRPDREFESHPYLYHLEYSRPQGEGVATLRTQIHAFDALGRGLLRWTWEMAEQWPGGQAELFYWEPPSGLDVKDY